MRRKKPETYSLRYIEAFPAPHNEAFNQIIFDRSRRSFSTDPYMSEIYTPLIEMLAGGVLAGWYELTLPLVQLYDCIMKFSESPDNSSKFSERCYNVLRRVPPGRVTSYAEIAKAIGTKAYRAVGQAMHRNPYAPTVPCHRVVRSDGSIGGYAWGSDKKIALLESEGVIVRDGTIHNLKDVFYPLS